MCQNFEQKTTNDLQKPQETHNTIFEKGKQFGLEETVCRSENDTHPIVESDFTVCENSVHDVLVPEQFQDSITTVHHHWRGEEVSSPPPGS